jgi:hypothetical protein
MSGSLQPVPLATLLPTTLVSLGWAFNASGVVQSVNGSLQVLSTVGAAYL